MRGYHTEKTSNTHGSAAAERCGCALQNIVSCGSVVYNVFQQNLVVGAELMLGAENFGAACCVSMLKGHKFCIGGFFNKFNV